MPWKKLTTWSNWIKDFETAVDIRYPSTRVELQDILEEAVLSDKKIKAVGSGHSHSMVAVPTNHHIAVDFHSLSGEIRNYRWLNRQARAESRYLVRMKAGTQIRHANIEILTPKGLALINQGPYDGQTIAGAINTNTHGTGLGMGGFADMVQSVEMLVVVPDASGQHKVEVWFVEPTEGISDPIQFRRRNRNGNKFLVQNDDIFYSAVCGYGLFGIAYSILLRFVIFTGSTKGIAAEIGEILKESLKMEIFKMFWKITTKSKFMCTRLIG